MLPEQKANTNIGICLGIVLLGVFRFLPQGILPPMARALVGISGSVLYLWGCASYATGKGQSPLWAIVALIPILGLLILVALPDNHSESAGSSMRGCGYIAIVFLLGIFGLTGWAIIYSRRQLIPASGPGYGASSASHARTVDEAQHRAIALYPELGIANSPLNREFVTRYKRYQITNKGYFRDPNWPVTLASESQFAITHPRSR